MYSLIDYSSNYSETTGRLWFYLKDEGTDFNDIANTKDFKSFKYKAKLLGNTFAQPNPNQTNGILKNATIAVPLKYLSNFWRSLEMPSINCKVELKLKWTKHCALCANGSDNVHDNYNANNIFTIKGTQLYVPVVTLSTNDNHKLSKLLSKGFERSVYWNKYKTKSENKNTTNEYRYFLESNFVGLFVVVYLNRNNDVKRCKTRKYYLPKGIIVNYNIISGNSFYVQAIDSDIKRYEENRKLTTGQVEDYTTECLLDYDYIKNNCRLIQLI